MSLWSTAAKAANILVDTIAAVLRDKEVRFFLIGAWFGAFVAIMGMIIVNLHSIAETLKALHP